MRKLRKGVHLFKAHYTDPDLSNLSEEARTELKNIEIKKIYVLRDPRSVISSMREFTADIPGRSRVLDKEMDGFVEDTIARWTRHVTKWCQAEGVCILKFEDIINNPQSALSRIEAFIDCKAETSGNELLPRKYRSKWSRRLFSRLEINPRSTEVTTSQRPLPWKQLLTDNHLQIIRKRAGPVIEKFGYEV